MSREVEKIAQDLFDKLRSRFEKISLGDEHGKHTSDPEKARFFNFDYSDDEDEYGNVTIAILDGESLKVYFGKNISGDMDSDSKDQWYEFLKQLRFFAKRNIMTFDTRDISRSNLNLKDIKQQSKADGTYSSMEITTESRLYGTPKHSFENIGTARIRILHTESVNPEQRGARSRHIHAIYVENAQGERFKLEHNKLSGARAMARHISEGGNPYDDLGTHINSMVQEMQELGRFVRGMRRRTFEDNTATTMVEAATNYYTGLNKQLNHLQSRRAYQSFVENFEPQLEQLDEMDVNELKEKFVKKIFDDRMTAALPHVYKAYQLHEQNKTRQIESVRGVIQHRVPLQLVTNEGMDEYFQALSFGNSNDLVVRILEDIGQRALAQPEIAEFARHWSANFNTVTEDSDESLKEHKAMAVQLVTNYLRCLREGASTNPALRISEEDAYYFELDDADILEEGTWAIPKSPEDLQKLQTLLKQPLPVGVDGQNATDALYDLLGDDQLFDKLGEFAEAVGPKEDARAVVKNFLKDNMPGLYTKLGLEAEGDEEMDAGQEKAPESPPPADAAAPEAAPADPAAAAPAPAAPAAPVAEDRELEQMRRIAGLIKSGK